MAGMVSGLCFELVDVIDIRCCIITIIIHILLLYYIILLLYLILLHYYTYTIILYLILYSSSSSSLLFSPFPLYSSLTLFFPSLTIPFPYSFYTCRYLHTVIYILFQSIFFPIIFFSSQYSFYTCRYLHILIYILSVSNNLTPHVLSEWMVEV